MLEPGQALAPTAGALGSKGRSPGGASEAITLLGALVSHAGCQVVVCLLLLSDVARGAELVHSNSRLFS